MIMMTDLSLSGCCPLPWPDVLYSRLHFAHSQLLDVRSLARNTINKIAATRSMTNQRNVLWSGKDTRTLPNKQPYSRALLHHRAPAPAQNQGFPPEQQPLESRLPGYV